MGLQSASMDLESELRVHDLRVTTPRRLVWHVLSHSTDHLTAQAIFEQVNAVDDAVNRSSVYRTLSLFAEIGLARESKPVSYTHLTLPTIYSV